MTKEDNEDFKYSTKWWICDNEYVDNDVKVRNHCHVTGNALHIEIVISILNHKIPNVFHNLKNYDPHLVMQELDKFNLKISVAPNGLKKYTTFTINNKLGFIDNFQFLRSSVDSLVKNLNKDDFKYLSQEFDNNVLDLVKQKGFYSYEYMADFEKSKEELLSKEKFYNT